MLWFYDKDNIVFISLLRCGSPAFLKNRNIHNLILKECFVRFLDPQCKSVKWFWECSLCFGNVDATLLSLYRQEWFTGCSKHKRLGIPDDGGRMQADDIPFFTDFLVPRCHNPQLCCGQILPFTNIIFANIESDLSLISAGTNYHQLNYAIWHQVALVFHCSLGGEAFPSITGELWLIIS